MQSEGTVLSMLPTSKAGKAVEQQELSLTAGGATDGSSHFARQFGGGLEKSNTLSLYHPALLLPGIYSKELKTCVHTDICVYSSFLHNG